MAVRPDVGRFGVILDNAPEFAQAFINLSQTTAETTSITKREKALVYLAVLAALGAEPSFRQHLKLDAEPEGIPRQAILEAVLAVVPAVGITPVMNVLEAIAEYQDPSEG
jgi:alkylhydroperoxidase/carboxymuconolactone decarboxylase family protein YurZ